jgi:hypothetical protein
VPIFQPKSNLITKCVLLSVIGGVFVAAGGWGLKWSPYLTLVGDFVQQPVPFSHAHHVGGLGLDCRYCHTSVEVSSNAGFPSTHTCMTCHSQIWTHAPVLEPVRQSYAQDRPIHWQRIYRLPDYVYFDHSVHVSKGVGCATCHGRVDLMPLTTSHKPFYMKECLDCHSNPGQFLRPKHEVFNLYWHPPAGQEERDQLAQKLVKEYRIAPARKLTDCYTCHR